MYPPILPGRSHGRGEEDPGRQQRLEERATCMIILAPTVWAAFLTYSGGFIVLFVFAFAGLVATTEP